MKTRFNTIPHNHKGFGALGLLLILAILAALAGAGWYVWQVEKSNASQSTQPSSKNSDTKPEQQTTHTSTEAVSLVQSTYTTALNYVKQTTRADQGEIDAIKSNISTDLYDKLSLNLPNIEHDQILCSQMRPDDFTTALGSTNGDTTTVLVNETFGTSSHKVTVSVDLRSLKITDIECP